MLSTSLSDLAGTVLLPGTWGAARPSFWCWQVANETVGATSFLLHEEHATRFREEYPECVGARLDHISSFVTLCINHVGSVNFRN